ncbi:hypothetical protein AvCA_14380 [Azotobacter vinelandii CA]|uniref:DUF2501 domain-containing protein n=2 Tax=Azotobacter vinelandii TaxID=354 RepID=C1DQY1_AZOVD|nr:DUF2501 domain-containing protein [Azotobacter vinelandii]ACO77654.1 hypothetical protein Avin_14380 [Azotobacter vinelandii DJ]AGK17002.1 hypothetical protein AvCA_14380 [Azotobacter vinelandii CA]AGK19911.1 hypothetical protein AvCA6_14380 [Azotobacter vinelandii CA6]WKN23422.1 DUF2501 domain-containing protein [Azotobacter vinelandii]SFX82506.1 Protein of unknown function [Azotobacter vinelandii]
MIRDKRFTSRAVLLFALLAGVAGQSQAESSGVSSALGILNGAMGNKNSGETTQQATQATQTSGLGGLGGLTGLTGVSVPSLDSVGTGNVAGVLQYCVNNNYLKSDASSISSKLTGLLGGQEEATQDEGYQQGLQGILGGDSGTEVDLSSSTLKQKLTDKVCDQVLSYGKSLL